jgi:O-acetyl-ADP-ribose deacetylase (regulator of RNase III)
VVLVIIEVTTGDLFTSSADALINPVNTEGAMGAGLALKFRAAYPEMFGEYLEVCKRRMLEVGTLHWWHTGGTEPRFVVNFPTKKLWREPSRLEWIDRGLQTLRAQVEARNVESLAIPALGCGLGGLPWDKVRDKIFLRLRPLIGVDVFLYPPR